MLQGSKEAKAIASNHRSVIGWMLFDWANQPFHTLVVTFIFAPYFVAQVASDPVAGQAAWGAAAAVAGAVTALLAPPLGAIADRSGPRKPWIAAFSVPFVLGCAGLWFAEPATPNLSLVLVCFALAYIGSELTFLFVNAILPDLGPRSEIGRISGSGWAIGYVGGVVSLLIVLALMSPTPGSTRTLIGIEPLFGLDPALGEPARATGPICALWYLIFAAPLFLFTIDRRPPTPEPVRTGLADLARTMRAVRGHRSLFAYLGASMLYRDALAALFVFGGIYAAGILGWDVFRLGLFGILAAATGAGGAWIGGRADSAYGPRLVVTASIWLLIGICMVVLLTTRQSVLLIPVSGDSILPDAVFLAAGGLLGVAAGALQGASRTLLVRQAEGRVAPAQAFGLYALSGKVTAFIGPALISVTTTLTESQRAGISPVILLFVLGLLLLNWVNTQDEHPERSTA